MQRTILIISLGSILGIIMGLYFESMVPICFAILLFLIILYLSNKKFKRYMKLFIKNEYVIIFLVACSLFYLYLSFCNKLFETNYNSFINSNTVCGTVISEGEEKKYTIEYIIKLKEIDSKKVFGSYTAKLYLKKQANLSSFTYGDILKIEGEVTELEVARNKCGFNAREYGKIQKNLGSIVTTSSNVKKANKANTIHNLFFSIQKSIKEQIRKCLPNESASILNAVLLGDKTQISNESIDAFRNSSLIYMLCVSGAHVGVILTGVEFLTNKLITRKKLIHIICIIVLCMFIGITGFSTSIARACIMGILMIVSKLLLRQPDMTCEVCFSLLILLIINPFYLFDIGMLLSYGGTIGIVTFSRIGKRLFRKKKHKKLLEAIWVCSTAQLFIIPIIAYYFNTINLTFLFSNLACIWLFSIIMYMGISMIFVSYIFLSAAQIIGYVLGLLIMLFQNIAIFFSNLPFSNIVITTPKIEVLVLYYMAILIFVCYIKNNWIREKIKKVKYKKTILLLCFLIILVSSIRFNNELTINFIDVGQGDCTLITATNGKTVLIDGGGSEDMQQYDVGEKVLVPYLLDKGIKNIDYIMVSHFHADHCNGLLAVIENLNIKCAIFAKQSQSCVEYENFISALKSRQVKIKLVEKGDKIILNNETKLEILFTGIKTNNLNNSSIITRLDYAGFSILFTGDAEKEEEQAVMQDISKEKLKATVLKLGHHGSNTSSSDVFLEAVSPRFVLIGCGKNNKFGHPKKEILDKLKGLQIYRTDLQGEITIKVNKSGKYKIETQIK